MSGIGDYEERVKSGKPTKRVRNVGDLGAYALLPPPVAKPTTPVRVARKPIVPPMAKAVIALPSRTTQAAHSPIVSAGHVFGGPAFVAPMASEASSATAGESLSTDSSSSPADDGAAPDDGSSDPASAPVVMRSASPVDRAVAPPASSSSSSSMLVPVAAAGGVVVVGGGLWWWKKKRARRSNPSRRRRRNPSAGAIVGGVGALAALGLGIALYLNAKTTHPTQGNTALPTAKEPTA